MQMCRAALLQLPRDGYFPGWLRVTELAGHAERGLARKAQGRSKNSKRACIRPVGLAAELGGSSLGLGGEGGCSAFANGWESL